jgi:hypothetical protein
MSVEPVEWHDYDPDTGVGNPDTPLSAALLNQQQAFVQQEADRAQAAADAAEAPTDAMVAGLIGSASATRTAGDARYALLTVSGKGVVRADSLVLNVRDYGAAGDGVADDTAEIQAAIDAAEAAGGGLVFMPKGTYLISSALTIQAANVRLEGAGRGVTRLLSNSGTANMIEVSLSSTRCSVGNMTLDRTAIATAGAGINVYEATGLANHMDFHDLYIRWQFRGMYLGPVSWGEVRNVIIERCADAGVFVTNNTENGACQWQFTTVLAQMCGSHGFRVYSQNIGAAQITLGQWVNVATFANTGRGLSFEGLATCPIQDIRVVGGFIGEDGGDAEVYLNTYGGSHVLSAMFVELAGSRTTGPTTSTAASAAGHGMYATPNNVSVQVDGHFIANARCGIYTEATRMKIDATLRANGTNATVGAASNSGLYVAAGRVVANIQSWGHEYGYYAAVATVRLSGDLNGNTTGAVGGTAPTSFDYIS